MASLVVAEHDNTRLNGATARTVAAALQISTPVQILVAGEACDGAAREAAKISGVEKILLAEDARYAHTLAEPMVELILTLAASFDVIAAPASANGKNILPRVAAKLDVPQISDIIGVETPDIFLRPIYAGNAIEKVEAKGFKKIVTVCSSAFQPAGGGGTAAIERIPAATDPALSHFAGETLSPSDRVDLATARIVVSGGRGLGSKENFAALERLADRLGAGLGATRAAVDAGFISNDHQIGQTGKVVAPDLYIAVGISGAIQHLAGMKESKIVVAINKDENAPIFAAADYALVGDLFQVLPELEQALEAEGPKA